jgi:hypothetical protein
VLSLPFKVNNTEVAQNGKKEREFEEKFTLPGFKISIWKGVLCQKNWLKGKHFIAPYRKAE